MAVLSIANKLIENCKSSNLTSLNFENLTESESRFVSCQYCPFNESELSIIFDSGKCLPSDYSTYFPLVYSLYGVILAVSLPGNILVVLTVISFKKLHSVTHFFIANMAVGDLLVTMFCIPFSVTSIIVLQYWPFGEGLCVTVNYIQAVSVFVSAYTLVAISLDRYLAILYPLRPRVSKYKAKVIMIMVWILAFITAIPVALFSKLVFPEERYYQHLGLKVCLEDWPTDTRASDYSWALMVLQYFFPVLVLLFTHCRIALYVWGSSGSGRQKHRPWSKMIRMTLTVVLVYTFCWLPFNVLQVVRDYSPLVHQWPNMHVLWFVCHWLAVSHSCYNPLILCWMNSKFRDCLLDLALRFCCLQGGALRGKFAFASTLKLRRKTLTTSRTLSTGYGTPPLDSRSHSRIGAQNSGNFLTTNESQTCNMRTPRSSMHEFELGEMISLHDAKSLHFKANNCNAEGNLVPESTEEFC